MIENKLKKVIFLTIIVFSITGIAASLILSIEYLTLLKDSGTKLSCDLSSIVSCSSVMKSSEANIFGFPNPYIGLISYSIFLTFGVLMLLNDSFPKFLKRLALIGSFVGFAFSYFLLFASVFKLNKICPYCILSCVSATNIFFAMVIFSLNQELIGIPEKFKGSIQNFITKGWYVPVIAVWYVVVVGMVVIKFAS